MSGAGDAARQLGAELDAMDARIGDGTQPPVDPPAPSLDWRAHARRGGFSLVGEVEPRAITDVDQLRAQGWILFRAYEGNTVVPWSMQLGTFNGRRAIRHELRDGDPPARSNPGGSMISQRTEISSGGMPRASEGDLIRSAALSFYGPVDDSNRPSWKDRVAMQWPSSKSPGWALHYWLGENQYILDGKNEQGKWSYGQPPISFETGWLYEEMTAYASYSDDGWIEAEVYNAETGEPFGTSRYEGRTLQQRGSNLRLQAGIYGQPGILDRAWLGYLLKGGGPDEEWDDD